MFRTFTTGLFLMFLAAVSNPAYADPFDDAVAAFDADQYEKAFELFTPLAEAGNDDAQFYLGELYLYGDGVAESNDKAFHWFMESAKAGDEDAQNKVGEMYDNGWGVKENEKSANKWYKKSAKNGSPEGQYNLGLNYKAGIGTKQNLQKAYEWFYAAASQDHDPSRVQLGQFYEEGYYVSQSLSEAVIYYKVAAKNNDPRGMYEYARMLESGPRDIKDTFAAQHWYEKAVDAGYDKAKVGLDRITAALEQDVRDTRAAEISEQKRLSDAADQEKRRKAALSAAGPLENGMTAYRAGDYQRALPVFEAHADNGDATAQNMIGVMYRDGKGVEQDDDVAIKWFLKAGDNGSGEAHYNYAKMAYAYRTPHPGKYNNHQAVGWKAMQKAARLGYQPAKDFIQGFHDKKQAEANERERLVQERLRKEAAEEAIRAEHRRKYGRKTITNCDGPRPSDAPPVPVGYYCDRTPGSSTYGDYVRRN